MASRNGTPVSRDDLRKELKAALKNYATKKDFERFATKKDLKRYATKEDFKRLATQENLDRLTRQVFQNSEDIKDIRANMVTKADFDRIMTILDGLATTYTQCWNQLIIHDERIRALEGQRA